MKSTFAIETRICGTATTIKIHSIPPTPPPTPLILAPAYSFYSRSPASAIPKGVCLHAARAYYPSPPCCSNARRKGNAGKWRRKKGKEEGEGRGDVFSGRVVLYHRKIGIEATPPCARTHASMLKRPYKLTRKHSWRLYTRGIHFTFVRRFF